MDFEVTINGLFSYIGKLYVEVEEAKKLLTEQIEENKLLKTKPETKLEDIRENS